MGYRKDDQYRDYSKRNSRDYEYRTRKLPTKGNRPSHVTVEPKGNEPIEKTIKRFLRKIKKSGLADEYKKRRFYEKPSTKKRKQRLRREATLKKLRQKEVK
tara:strand:- start:212 stop:514 length:303 start_codon:yes stop_codon:yes gene_type:complete